MKEIEVIEYSTFFKIPKIPGINYSKFTRNLSTLSYYTREYEPYGFKGYDTHYRCMKIPRGLLLSSLRECGLRASIRRESDFPYKPTADFKLLNQPINNIQESVIQDTLNNFKSGESRSIISLKTGKGKTYVATNIISQLRVKALIMVKSVELKNQWVKSFKDHTDCKNVFSVDKGSDLSALAESQDFNPDIIVCTHKSMALFIEASGEKAFAMMLLKLGIGIKVYDEFDLENASMFNMDMNSSIRYNLYLSATDYKSNRSENFIFTKIFSNVYNTGKEYEDTTKRNAVFYLYESKPSKKEFASCLQYSPQGFVFSYAKYHEYITKRFPYKEILKKLWETFIKERFKNGLKTVFFIGRKTTSDDFKAKLLEIFDVDEKDIAILNSNTPKSERLAAFNSLLIVSTSNSLGRGIDLKGLDTVLDFETRNSKSATSQVVGRVSRTGMKNVGTYIQFVDYSFPTVKDNYERKMTHEFFHQFFTDIKVRDIKSVEEGE